ncbi:acetylglutamate kinase [Alkalicoccus chagannorensis]|uniref:acetylglutamate kinase n=1 Tax=Alkalicoccus chagannorensis TaxID=427072 RepID=UPI00040BF7BB|nr:acetylglutamate kinase [Alkalicoccus chagannorensis]
MKQVVIKIGGSLLQELPAAFYQTINRIKEERNLEPVIVHGGGPAVNELLQVQKIDPIFQDGLRVTCRDTADVCEKVLSGSVNKQIVRCLQAAGISAAGISGADAGMLETEARRGLGYVGKVTRVNTSVIDALLQAGITPVISPVSTADDGVPLNVNADEAAGAVAAAMEAELLFITDVAGVMNLEAVPAYLYSELNGEEAESLIGSGIISGGMIPKVRAALQAAEASGKTVMLDGKNPEALAAWAADGSGGTTLRKDMIAHG